MRALGHASEREGAIRRLFVSVNKFTKNLFCNILFLWYNTGNIFFMEVKLFFLLEQKSRFVWTISYVCLML